MTFKSTSQISLSFIISVTLFIFLILLLSLHTQSVASPNSSAASSAASYFANTQAPTWTVQTVDHADLFFQEPDLRIDINNVPKVAYFEGRIENNMQLITLTYAYMDDSGWITKHVRPAGVYDGGSTDLSLALDSNQNPHIAYTNFTEWSYPYLGGHLKYAWHNGVNWNVDIVDYGKQGSLAGYMPSLAIDSNDIPHIGYVRYNYTGTYENVGYAYKPDSTWITETIEVEQNIGWYLDLVLDSNDRPHMVYSNRGPSNIKHVWRDIDIWYTEVITSMDIRDMASTIDKHDTIHIVMRYSDPLHGPDEIWYARQYDADWEWEHIPSIYGYIVSLKTNDRGMPYLAYSAGGGLVEFTYKDGYGNWNKEPINSVAGNRISLDLDTNECPQVVFPDGNHSILQYATRRCPVGLFNTSFPAIFSQ
jgi:hypothetical protein